MRQVLLLLLCAILPLVASSNDADAFDAIDKLIRLRDYPRAVSQLGLLAQQGSSEARYRLAGLYRSGKGVSADPERSRKLYRQAAIAGHAEAQFVLALLIEKSHDPAAATEPRRWYRMAAAQGHERAAARLEHLRDESAEVRPDIDSAEIFSAIQHNHLEFIDALLARGANLDLIDEQGNTPVMAALLAGWPDLAASLIPATRFPGQANANGMLPLQLASSRGYRNIVKALLDNKVDMDLRDARGNTALMLALQNGHTQIAALLLERGANPNLLNNRNRSALDIAIALDNAQGRSLLGRYGAKLDDTSKATQAISLTEFKSAVARHGARYAGWPLLNIAVELGEDQVVDQIIAQGADLGATDSEGNGALQVAARKGDVARMRQLLALGADPDAVNDNSETALYLSVDSKCMQCAQLLLKLRANPSIETVNGVTPLEVAVQTSQVDAARLLLAEAGDYAGIHRVLLIAVQRKHDKLASELVKRDTRLAVADASGRSILWHSADRGLKKTTVELANSGKIVLDQQDKNGRSAISQAVVRGHLEIVRILADRGANLAQRSAAGNSLLMLAVLAEKPEIIDFLLARPIDLNASNNLGNTVLMLAAASAHNRVVEKLIAAGADLQLRNGEDLNAFQIATDSGHKDTAQLIHDSSNLMFKIFN